MNIGYVLDDVTINEFGRGNTVVTQLIANLDARAIRMSIPAVTLAVAQHDLGDAQIDAVHGTIKFVEHVRLEAVSTLDETQRISEVYAYLADQPDPAAAHVVAVSRHLGFPVLTTNRKRWDPVLAQLPWTVEVFEISDTD
ncbi:hypothetical protein GCM10010116_11800 [Microbispora rosea subsp. aerata]|nr:hypothetical protein [Microbispora rosea]GGO05999.1 hypothetical protein GCM10010116_11800 [Microbispora rosea subsp. aerata]GIH55211.1 hypothetical protein Mro02_21250 [Microbispora rosea subsp. aerata]GLJ82661.1 hypothetical protein GCM10017588_13860 [Microbispora rosea subsp. aerata]